MPDKGRNLFSRDEFDLFYRKIWPPATAAPMAGQVTIGESMRTACGLAKNVGFESFARDAPSQTRRLAAEVDGFDRSNDRTRGVVLVRRGKGGEDRLVPLNRF